MPKQIDITRLRFITFKDSSPFVKFLSGRKAAQVLPKTAFMNGGLESEAFRFTVSAASRAPAEKKDR